MVLGFDFNIVVGSVVEGGVGGEVRGGGMRDEREEKSKIDDDETDKMRCITHHDMY